ncbi:hypothetical protein VHUM_02216 [Vanrija humicola]|uniref:Uncharacterized protein n=1 Tax=Vanrija humicola TaxID=5417 RepID=A0A7D8UZG5_VANHU|nr:hypothetical protein VHUM_02216 [Vanrija humicola]
MPRTAGLTTRRRAVAPLGTGLVRGIARWRMARASMITRGRWQEVGWQEADCNAPPPLAMLRLDSFSPLLPRCSSTIITSRLVHSSTDRQAGSSYARYTRDT